MSGPSPFGNLVALAYLDELEEGISVTELEALLETDAPDDLELTQEQYALAAVIAAAHDGGWTSPDVARIAESVKDQVGAEVLLPAAHACMNRLLYAPFAPLWREQRDGGVAIRRQARALRARLHRACTG